MAAQKRSQLQIDALSPCHDRQVFSCGVEALDRYLKHQASQDLRKHVAVTFVLVEVGQPGVLGFYTLSATNLRVNDLPESTAKKLPRYPLVPAILLGRLAVGQTHRGKGYGELLLIDALKRCLAIEDIGWAVVLVDAKGEEAAAFYEHYDFIRLAQDSSRLFLPRSTIASLIG